MGTNWFAPTFVETGSLVEMLKALATSSRSMYSANAPDNFLVVFLARQHLRRANVISSNDFAANDNAPVEFAQNKGDFSLTANEELVSFLCQVSPNCASNLLRFFFDRADKVPVPVIMHQPSDNRNTDLKQVFSPRVRGQLHVVAHHVADHFPGSVFQFSACAKGNERLISDCLALELVENFVFIVGYVNDRVA